MILSGTAVDFFRSSQLNVRLPHMMIGKALGMLMRDQRLNTLNFVAGHHHVRQGDRRRLRYNPIGTTRREKQCSNQLTM